LTGNVTFPGRACFSKRDITLRNGTAAIPIPSLTPPGGYQLQIDIPPQYGQLGNGGPPVAVLGLLCSGTGSYSGTGTVWHSVVVFDGQAGRPRILGLFTGSDLGTVGSLGVWLQPRQLHVGNGAITVTGLYLQAQDAHCCPSGHGTVTISYRNGRLVPSKVMTTTTAPGSAPSGATSQPSAPGIGRTLTATTPSGHTYVATVQAEDVASDCAANSYGTPVFDYFRQHPCPRGAGRRLVAVPFEGRTVALSMIEVDAQVGGLVCAPSATTCSDSVTGASHTCRDLRRGGPSNSGSGRCALPPAVDSTSSRCRAVPTLSTGTAPRTSPWPPTLLRSSRSATTSRSGP
jgi:hypothetical protein